jgi:hypothetical protein
MGAKEAETDPPKEDDWQNTYFTHHGRSFERVTVECGGDASFDKLGRWSLLTPIPGPTDHIKMSLVGLSIMGLNFLIGPFVDEQRL